MSGGPTIDTENLKPLIAAAAQANDDVLQKHIADLVDIVADNTSGVLVRSYVAGVREGWNQGRANVMAWLERCHGHHYRCAIRLSPDSVCDGGTTCGDCP